MCGREERKGDIERQGKLANSSCSSSLSLSSSESLSVLDATRKGTRERKGEKERKKGQGKREGVKSRLTQVTGTAVEVERKSSESEGDFLTLCKLSSPIVKRIPKRVLPLFAKSWADLLSDAVFSGLAPSWWRFFAFPRLVLLTPARGGSRLSAGKRSVVAQIQERIATWSVEGERAKMLLEAQQRSMRPRQVKVDDPGKENGAESAIVRALRLGDVKKALRLLCSAPLAEKGTETLEALKKLHP